MKHLTLFCVAAILFPALPAAGQDRAVGKEQEQPIFNVTVVERSVKAINYEYRAGPTKIDFRGTVLLPQGKGEASVDSRRGRTEIEAKFENMTAPARYGREYLTYTLWAITPEGAARNLGEIVPNGSDKASLHVTTDLQAFGLIVTAEPYSAAHQPSDVVVLENEVRADTVGQIQPIEVKYELMPRGHYTLQLGENLQPAAANTAKVSMDKYEALLEVYEAQNAIGIARAAGAKKYAASTLEKAQTLLNEAQRLQASKSASSTIVQEAREASETAEDARVIAERRGEEEKLAAARQEAAQAHEAQAQALAALQTAKAEADAQRAQAESKRVALEKAQADAADARRQAEQAQAEAEAARMAAQASASQTQQSNEKIALRTQLFEQLKTVLPTLDTPRGLVVTVADSAFKGPELREEMADQVVRLAAIVKAHPELRVDVQGYADGANSETISSMRAEAVGRILLSQGLDAIAARGLGDSRPLVPNSSPANRAQNRRVEIVISGQSIGNLAAWDRTYSVMPNAMKRDNRY
jgi:outer membrane protein OmpA-like peptidoglycan-associated protein